LDELQSKYNFHRPHDPLASTEFTYTRFLVPWLQNYRGTALFCDNDMLCLSDIAEIAALPMNGLALRVVKHDYHPNAAMKMYGCPQTSYPRKNWSSLMLMNCDRLKCWSKTVVETGTGAQLHRFQDVPDAEIGELPREWNVLDARDEKTKLIHWTSGGPWFDQYKDAPHAKLWTDAEKLESYCRVQLEIDADPCSRCGGVHKNLTYSPLAPGVTNGYWTHSATCPANGGTVLMTINDDEVDNALRAG
jgi:hypothetical protein